MHYGLCFPLRHRECVKCEPVMTTRWNLGNQLFVKWFAVPGSLMIPGPTFIHLSFRPVWGGHPPPALVSPAMPHSLVTTEWKLATISQILISWSSEPIWLTLMVIGDQISPAQVCFHALRHFDRRCFNSLWNRCWYQCWSPCTICKS